MKPAWLEHRYGLRNWLESDVCFSHANDGHDGLKIDKLFLEQVFDFKFQRDKETEEQLECDMSF